MANLTRRKLFGLPALAPSAGGIFGKTLAPTNVSDEAGDKNALAAREKIRKRYFPDVVLYTHEGKKVRFYEDLIKGKIVTINVMYATCERLSGITANLGKVQNFSGSRRSGSLYVLITKPEQDTPGAQGLHEMHGVGPGWTYLTGSLKTSSYSAASSDLPLRIPWRIRIHPNTLAICAMATSRSCCGRLALDWLNRSGSTNRSRG
jgi:cytochrome oxidase Cu insertion factor (SCO1/SenC/PrrC family)